MKKLTVKVNDVVCNSAESPAGIDHFYMIGVVVINQKITKTVSFETQPVAIAADCKLHRIKKIMQGFNSAYTNRNAENSDQVIADIDFDDDGEIYFYIMAFDEYLQNTWNSAAKNCSELAEYVKESIDNLKKDGVDCYEALKGVILNKISEYVPYDSENYLKENYTKLDKGNGYSNVLFNFRKENELYTWDYTTDIEFTVS